MKNLRQAQELTYKITKPPKAELINISTDVWLLAIKLDITMIHYIPWEVYTKFSGEEVKAIYRKFAVAENGLHHETLSDDIDSIRKAHPPNLIFEVVLEMAPRLGLAPCLYLFGYDTLKLCINDVFPDGIPSDPFLWKHYVYTYPPLLTVIKKMKLPIHFHAKTYAAMEKRLTNYTNMLINNDDSEVLFDADS